MEQNPNTKMPDLVDTTDCLEAIDSIRSMKNFPFVLIFLCLLITAGIFALDRTDRIDRTVCGSCGACPITAGVCPMTPAAPGCCPAVKQPVAQTPAPAPKAVDVNEPAKTAAKQPDGSDPNAEFLTKVKDLFDSAGQNAAQKQLPAILRLRPACKDVAIAIKTCNFILVLAATMYCLMLLMSLKISLAGRLGGISHICRAFFLSLFVLVVLLPWQVLLPGVVAGAIYTPHELLCQWHANAQLSTFWLVLCYLRFAGLWLLVWIGLIAAQLRSRKWTKATLRRLGLVR